LSADTASIWATFSGLMVLLVVMFIAFYSTARNEQVFQGDYRFNPNARAEASFVTDVFELKGRTSDLVLTTDSNVDNTWMYFDYALINQDSGQAYDFGREVGYYYGHDEDGSWSEGNRDDKVTIPSVPPGSYYFRVEPESDARAGIISYTITAKRDVPQASFFGIALLALLVPAGLITWRSMNFEHLRWAESDYGSSGSGDDNDSDDANKPMSLGNLFGKKDS
jgi:hypothetical protein